VRTSGQVLGIVWYVCFVYIIVCLHFININKENTLYGFLDRLYIKCFETWWISSPIPNSQFCRASFLNSLFVYIILAEYPTLPGKRRTCHLSPLHHPFFLVTHPSPLSPPHAFYSPPPHPLTPPNPHPTIHSPSLPPHPPHPFLASSSILEEFKAPIRICLRPCRLNLYSISSCFELFPYLSNFLRKIF
jgi:hypothetical protein